MQARILRAMRGFPSGVVPAGAIINQNPQQALFLVRLGAAEPADEECRQACGMSDQQLAAAQHAYRRADAGIHPDDFAAFDAGEMTGYFADGSPIPGPAAIEEDEDPAPIGGCEEEYDVQD